MNDKTRGGAIFFPLKIGTVMKSTVPLILEGKGKMMTAVDEDSQRVVLVPRRDMMALGADGEEEERGEIHMSIVRRVSSVFSRRSSRARAASLQMVALPDDDLPDAPAMPFNHDIELPGDGDLIVP